MHLDLDVVDSAEVPGLHYPAPGGPGSAQVAGALHMLLGTGRVAAVGIACTWHPGHFAAARISRYLEAALAGFEMDPIAIYHDVATPYAWYGIRPELFDAPSRGPGDDPDWEAHSFLCVSPDAVITPRVQAIAGLSWGFTRTGEDISFTQPDVLGPQSWDDHLDLLTTTYPDWTFDDVYLWCLIVASIRIARQDVMTTRSAA